MATTKCRVFKISPDGRTIIGLHTDALSHIGSQEIQRASQVEFDQSAGGWTVEFLLGPLRGSRMKEVFAKRSDALAAEIEELNRQILAGAL